MPAPISYAHKTLRYAAELLKTGTITWLRPDSKRQVSVVYEGNRPVRIDNVVVSHQHDDGVSYEEIKETIINPVFGESNLRWAAWSGRGKSP